jgi:hypothetical protein
VKRSIIAGVIATLIGVMPAVRGQAWLREWWFGESWGFVQAVGGIRVGGVTRAPDGAVTISVECDVSGLRSITRTPDQPNSAIGVGKTLVAVEGRRMAISIRTALGVSSSCPPLRFEHLDPGEYSVVYLGADRSPHEIGSVTVP